MLSGVLNDELVVGLPGLVYQLIYRGHILFGVCAPGLLLLCFRLVQFLKTNISQDSVMTMFICIEMCIDHFVANFLLRVSVKEFWTSFNVTMAKIWTKVWCRS